MILRAEFLCGLETVMSEFIEGVSCELYLWREIIGQWESPCHPYLESASALSDTSTTHLEKRKLQLLLLASLSHITERSK